MALTCPDGGMWRDDDSGGGMKPLIKAETSTAGWCTLQVCGWAAAALFTDLSAEAAAAKLIHLQ